MRQVLRLAGLLGMAVLVVPSVAQETATPEGADPKLVAKALAQPFLQGKLVGVDIEKKTFSIQAIVDSKKTLNKEGQKRYAQLYAQASQAYRAKNKGELDRLVAELQTAALGVYDVKETTHTFKLQGGANFEVRVEKLPPREGDDGKIKAYTPAELSKLKGNTSLPGYMADPKGLDVEVQVKAYLIAKDKGKTPAKPEPPKLVIKTAGSADKPEMMAEDAHPVSVILIVPKADLMIPGVPVPGGVNPFVIK